MLQLSLGIKHQETLGNQKRTVFQESQKLWKKTAKNQRITKALEKNKKWRLLGGPSISQDFLKIVCIFL